jgi:hypothetical protein
VWCAREIYALRVFSILQILISRCRAWKQRLQFFIDLLQTLKRFHAATLPMDRYDRSSTPAGQAAPVGSECRGDFLSSDEPQPTYVLSGSGLKLRKDGSKFRLGPTPHANWIFYAPLWHDSGK